MEKKKAQKSDNMNQTAKKTSLWPGHINTANLRQMNLNNFFLASISVILIGATLHAMRSIFVPLAFALLMNFMFMPIVDSLERRGIPRLAGALVVISLLTTILVLFGGILVANIRQFYGNLDTYEIKLNDILHDFLPSIPGYEANPLPTIDLKKGLQDTFYNDLDTFLNNASTSLSFFGRYMVISLFVIFLLAEGPFFNRKISLAFKGKRRHQVYKIISTMSKQITRYLFFKMILSLMTAIVVWIILSIVGLEASLTWAFFTFLFNFIPNLGSIIITILISIMALIEFYPSWDIVLTVAGGVTATQMVIGNFLDPKIQGDQLNTSPFIILLSVAVWGWLLGTAGLFIAVPLTEIIKVVCSHIPSLNPIAIFIGSGRDIPPLAGEIQGVRFLRRRSMQKAKTPPIPNKADSITFEYSERENRQAPPSPGQGHQDEGEKQSESDPDRGN